MHESMAVHEETAPVKNPNIPPMGARKMTVNPSTVPMRDNHERRNCEKAVRATILQTS
ncbi:MAG: hypothetical protein JETT_3895 [Candidatus Jettenia ecosi]|uniref:Uncharacterized protein n=1 Tax=Candidatus Jettenia ecosi TaxID=2494326 RepID=A0A533Q5M7_9BACT|nr:MAG: hypothetical protein JETT_3895 [Candidatus Jettenia ecosi]